MPDSVNDRVEERAIREQCRASGVSYFGKQDYSPGGGPKRHLPGDLGDQEWPDGVAEVAV